MRKRIQTNFLGFRKSESIRLFSWGGSVLEKQTQWRKSLYEIKIKFWFLILTKLLSYTVNIYRQIIGNNFVTLYPGIYTSNQSKWVLIISHKYVIYLLKEHGIVLSQAEQFYVLGLYKTCNQDIKMGAH